MIKIKAQFANCKYCQQQVIWKNKKCYDGEGKRHWCTKYPRPKVIEVVRTVDPQDVKDLREEIGTLRAEIARLSNPKPEPQHGLEKRVLRLEALVVELRNGYTDR